MRFGADRPGNHHQTARELHETRLAEFSNIPHRKIFSEKSLDPIAAIELNVKGSTENSRANAPPPRSMTIWRYDAMSDNAKSTRIARTPQKKLNILPFLAAAALVLCAAVVFLTRADDASSVAARDNGGAITLAPGEFLVIPTAEISDQASFYPVTVNGTTMEVIAVKDSAGNIRTAFNTCQVCYDSGTGYYVQSGPYLVCQNCGNRFSMDQVGIAAGGCNPWPIFAENKTVTADSISLSYDFLAETREIFANWKSAGTSPLGAAGERLTLAEAPLAGQARPAASTCCAGRVVAAPRMNREMPTASCACGRKA